MRLQGSQDLLANEIAKTSRVTTKEGPDFGLTTTELTFLPIQPCRYIDTRNVGGPIVGSRQYDLDAAGNVYGGSAACDPIASTVGAGFSFRAAALAANVAIVSPTAAPGFIGARPVGSTNTTALVNWYEAGPSVQASNAGILGFDQQQAVTNEIEFFGSPTQIIVDVFGVFASPTATALDCVQQSVTASVPANGFDVLTATCPAGYTVSGGGYDGASLGVNSSWSPENRPSGNGWLVSFYNRNTAAFTMEAFAICCRIPGR